MSVYTPGWQSKEYHRLASDERDKVNEEVNRRFTEKTGVTRKLHATSKADLELRRTWLRIRDEVMDERAAEEDMEFRRSMFIDDLPAIVVEDMLSMGWSEAAELLEIWAERPPATAPSYSAPVTNVIKMDWVLGFQRAKTVYDKLIADKIWTNEASQKRFAEHLKKNPRSAGSAFGDLSRSVTIIDDEWINSRSVTGGWSWDALAGALGSFTFQVAVAGRVVSSGSGRFEIAVQEVGVYVKDSFDFEGSQFLGFWGYRDDPVNNSDFRQWRSQSNRGGDFRVFSDVKRTKLSPADVVSGKL